MTVCSVGAVGEPAEPQHPVRPRFDTQLVKKASQKSFSRIAGIVYEKKY
jgi:hypothetical protein